MYHSININGYNTWTSWHLIPTSRPLVNLPPINEKTVTIPGRSGVIDLSTYLTNTLTYGNRKGSWEFYVIQDEWGSTSWATVYRTIASAIHGKTCNVVLEDDPNWQYTGRLKLGSWKSSKDYSTITIEYDLEPYKLNTSSNSTSPY